MYVIEKLILHIFLNEQYESILDCKPRHISLNFSDLNDLNGFSEAKFNIIFIYWYFSLIKPENLRKKRKKCYFDEFFQKKVAVRYM